MAIRGCVEVLAEPECAVRMSKNKTSPAAGIT
eukprot:COSAG06_NODE_26044_length_623_cov_0.753817_1_plen_31_part_10